MKHLLLIIFFATLGYVLWAVASKQDRRKALGFAMRHGWRLGVLVMVVIALLVAMFHSRSISIL